MRLQTGGGIHHTPASEADPLLLVLQDILSHQPQPVNRDIQQPEDGLAAAAVDAPAMYEGIQQLMATSFAKLTDIMKVMSKQAKRKHIAPVTLSQHPAHLLLRQANNPLGATNTTGNHAHMGINAIVNIYAWCVTNQATQVKIVLNAPVGSTVVLGV